MKTSLHDIIKKENKALLESKIKALKPFINDRNKKGSTALLIAAIKGKASLVKILIDHGANPNIQDKDGDTPLHFAAYRGRNAIIKQLINAKANVNTKNKCGLTPLHTAIVSGNLSTVEQLLLNGASIRPCVKIMKELKRAGEIYELLTNGTTGKAKTK